MKKNRREHFRGVVWPRDPISEEGKPTNYRYLVFGFLVSDEPIEGFEGQNEVVLDSDPHGMSDLLKKMPKYKNAGYPYGEIDTAVCRLNQLEKKRLTKRSK